MRYSTTTAIDFEAMVARNREIIMEAPAMPLEYETGYVWSPEELAYLLVDSTYEV